MLALGTKRLKIATATLGVVCVVVATSRAADEPSRIGRLFRLGGSSRSNETPVVGKPSSGNASKPEGMPRGATAPPAALNPPPGNLPAYGPLTPTAPVSSAPGSRITPQPRVSRAATESDPLVTRVSIGRSDDGKQFCMFIQIYADGTILDSEGIHHVGADHLRPIASLLQSGELTKLKGHCGGPAADFIEQVQVVAYDRYHGKLRATSFSYSGNPQGCDPSVRKLNETIDAIQLKLTSTAALRSTGSPAQAAPPLGQPVQDPTAPLPPFNSAPLGLTPDGGN